MEIFKFRQDFEISRYWRNCAWSGTSCWHRRAPCRISTVTVQTFLDSSLCISRFSELVEPNFKNAKI